MSQSKETARVPNGSNAGDRKKRAERRARDDSPDVGRSADGVTRAVKLRTSHGARTVEVTVSPLATDPHTVDLARRREGIPTRHFNTGEVLS